jgi:hypothetical protein
MSTLDSGPIAALLSGTTGTPSGPASVTSEASSDLDKMKALSTALSRMEDPTVILKMMSEDAQKKLSRQQEILAILKELNGSGSAS